jgi:hypothetical protein
MRRHRRPVLRLRHGRGLRRLDFGDDPALVGEVGVGRGQRLGRLVGGAGKGGGDFGLEGCPPAKWFIR